LRLAALVVATVAAAFAVLVVGSTGGGPADAFAGWAAVPTPPARGQLRAAQAACERRSPRLAAATPIVSDTRGADSLLVYTNAGQMTTCVTGRIQLGTVVLSRAASPSHVAVGAVEPESIGLEFAADGQLFREMTGEAGAGVKRVALVLERGSVVRASVRGGWFAAWWPVSQGFLSGKPLARAFGGAAPRSFLITTTSGTRPRPLTLAEIQHAVVPPTTISDATAPSPSTGSTAATGSSAVPGAAAPGTSGRSGNTGGPRPGLDSALSASFAVLRQPGPSPVPLPPDLAGAYTGPAQPANPYGIDPNLARYVAPAHTWILPGSSGLCVITIGIVGPGVGSGNCNSTLLALSGDFFVPSKQWPTKQIVVVGLAPDGNRTVDVTDTDGSTREVRVTDNVYVVRGGHPSSIKLRDASGALTTVPIP
jgi:hypothetical protein